MWMSRLWIEFSGLKVRDVRASLVSALTGSSPDHVQPTDEPASFDFFDDLE